MNRYVKALSLFACVIAFGCGADKFDNPTTPASPGYIELHRVTYTDGVISGTVPDSTIGPILRLWDKPGRQANLVAAVLSPYYYPIPTSISPPPNLIVTPRAAFLGNWKGGMVVGDSIVMPLSDFRDVPDTAFSDTAGYAVAVFDTINGFDIAHMTSRVVITKGNNSETLINYWTLGRKRSLLEVIPQ